MADDFTEKTDWPGAAWAFAVWAAHFSILWGASSVFPGSPAAKWIAAVATVGAMAALAALWRIRGATRAGPMLAASAGMSLLAIVFGALPAVIG